MNNYITYGYRLVDGDMRMDLGQSEAVHLIFDAYDGGESIKKIVGMLKDRKAPTTRGKPSWTPALIRKILRNKIFRIRAGVQDGFPRVVGAFLSFSILTIFLMDSPPSYASKISCTASLCPESSLISPSTRRYP